MNQPPEFDQYARTYNKDIAHPLRNLLESGSENEFLRYKARWVLKHLRRDQINPQSILDFGCGTGLMMKYLSQERPELQMYGVDVSSIMVEEAKKNVPHANVAVLTPGIPAFPDKKFEIIVLCGVLHHIDAKDWSEIWKNLKLALAPEGRILIFEHNPMNPITQLVVRTTAIDKDAHLEYPWTIEKSLKSEGFRIVARRYLHFFPPRWTSFLALEYWLSKVPLGSQFVIKASLSKK